MQLKNIKQEFFTLDTRISIEHGNIYHKKVKHNDSGPYRLIAFLTLIVIIVYSFYQVVEDHKYYKILRVLLWLILFAPLFKSIYSALFIKTWKSIIPLKDVKNITAKPLENGLETEVTLHLSSGRKKYYVFRNAEGQLETFTQAVAAQTSLPVQMAM